MTGLWIFSETVGSWSCFLAPDMIVAAIFFYLLGFFGTNCSGLSALQLCRWQRDFLKSLLHCWFRAVEFHPVQGTIEKKVIQTKQNPLCLNIRCLVDMNGWWYDMWYHWYHDSDVYLCYGANLKSSNPVFWQIWQIWQCWGAMVWLVTDFPTNHRLRSQATKRRTGRCTAFVLFQGKMHCEHRGIYPGRLTEQLSDILDGISLPWCRDLL